MNTVLWILEKGYSLDHQYSVDQIWLMGIGIKNIPHIVSQNIYTRKNWKRRHPTAKVTYIGALCS